MEFEVTILGCGSATPSLRHLPSSQVVAHGGKLFMVDCGEGAQLEMMRNHVKWGKLNNVFISHLHGDHMLGLFGMISTMALHSKGAALTIHIFREGAELIQSMMKFLVGDTPFNLNFNIIDPKVKNQVVYEDNTLTVTTFPLYHRVDTVGFIFREKSMGRHIDGEAAKFHGVPNYFMRNLRVGEDFVKPDGTMVANALLTTDATPPASYAYCTDTAFDRRLVASLRGVETIYHDATYGDDAAHMAAPRGHCTARQAGEIARRAGARTLILGHFSKRYDCEDALLRQAAEEFDGHIIVADEGMKINLRTQ